jgi:hypothetical protein
VSNDMQAPTSGSANDWQPGKPIRTPADTAAWEAWRKACILAGQRDRRAKRRRIDYYPSDEAAAIITAAQEAPGDSFSSVINLIIEDWAANLEG